MFLKGLNKLHSSEVLRALKFESSSQARDTYLNSGVSEFDSFLGNTR